MTANQTRAEAVAMITDVLLDPDRIDRFLQQAKDGHYYTTDAEEYISDDGPYHTPSVKIPQCYDDISDEHAEEWAESLITELDEQIATEQE